VRKAGGVTSDMARCQDSMDTSITAGFAGKEDVCKWQGTASLKYQLVLEFLLVLKYRWYLLMRKMLRMNAELVISCGAESLNS
jgi:hypothetical protein